MPAYLQLVRRRHGGAMVAADSELVIDGFTRTAVTFAVVAFQLAQPRPVRVAHHLHAPAHVVASVRAGIPCLLTVREPAEAVLSCCSREPYVSLAQALRAYARFHETLAPFRAGFVAAPFDEVTQHFDVSIERLNQRFGTHFAPFRHSDENVRRCFGIIDQRAQRPPWARELGAFLSGRITLAELDAAAARHQGQELSALPEMRVQRPTAARAAQKQALLAAYQAPELAAARRRAELAYQAVLA